MLRQLYNSLSRGGFHGETFLKESLCAGRSSIGMLCMRHYIQICFWLMGKLSCRQYEIAITYSRCCFEELFVTYDLTIAQGSRNR